MLSDDRERKFRYSMPAKTLPESPYFGQKISLLSIDDFWMRYTSWKMAMFLRSGKSRKNGSDRSRCVRRFFWCNSEHWKRPQTRETRRQRCKFWQFSCGWATWYMYRVSGTSVKCIWWSNSMVCSISKHCLLQNSKGRCYIHWLEFIVLSFDTATQASNWNPSIGLFSA